MGSIFALNYANLFMGYIKHRYICNCDVNPFYSRIMKWCRYIDDFFNLFLGDQEEAHEFVTVLNTLLNFP